MRAKASGAAQRREGASTSRARFLDRYRSWRDHHSLSAADSLRRVLDNLGSSLLTWLVIGIAMALPTALSVALDNAREVSGSWDSPAQISLFLLKSTGAEAAQALQAELQERGDVAEAVLVDKVAALEEFAELSGFTDVVASLDENPLPHLLLVSPATGVEPSVLQAELLALQPVEQAVVDMAWVQRLNNLMDLSRRLVLGLAGVLVLGVVLILGNTIRLAIENRRDEIIIVKLVGGSNAFVRRPFLYTGLWYGVGGGFIAALLVLAALFFLEQPVSNLASLYQSNFQLSGIGLIGSLQLVLLGGALGLIGAWLAVSRHLGAIEPR
ncbi:cell division protein [Parahaliea sp. F7430]|uniref:Cell division protein FtsX n=1 Tax=Sediminihaliea albiluteola TaxID=2758564 RepID=A0A7W2YJG9_9GAMM|nr:permease-like cell division protein FtsX [Sediminihaliea albiluteola]MBA6413571.1 cell division protein [Sediminihaliea albiluteola]